LKSLTSHQEVGAFQATFLISVLALIPKNYDADQKEK
jgi:hypothetical protein